MADFYYYLNRQGIRGLQGVKGDQGDSPIITVQTETPNEYVLRITNPDGTELISPNLRGNKININEGTYVRYNTETGELYTSTADGATGELAGVVRLATDEDIADMDEAAVITPGQLADALSRYLTSPDGSVKIIQNEDSSLTELTVQATGQDIDQLKSDVSTLQGEVSVLNTEIDTKSPKLTAGDNITLTSQDDGTIKIDSTASGTGDVTAAGDNTLTGNNTLTGDNTFTGTNTFTKDVSIVGLDVQATLNAKSGTIDNLQVPYTLTNSGKINAVEIEVAGIHDSDNKKYLNETDLDGQTISMVDGKVHVNMDELGNEVNDLSGRVTANEADITTLKSDMTDVTGDVESKQNKLIAGDNVTLTNNEDGTTTISAESSIPDNMVTTDTEQTITGKKIFSQNSQIGSFSVYSEGYYNDVPHLRWQTDSNNYVHLMMQQYGSFSFMRNGSFCWTFSDPNSNVANDSSKLIANLAKDVYIQGSTGGGLLIQGGNNSWDLVLSDQQKTFTFLRSKDIDNDTIKLVDGKLVANVSVPEVNTATTETAGIVKPDGNTITITEDGTLTAVSSSPGIIDGGNASGGVARAQVVEVASPLVSGAMPSVTIEVKDVE